MKWLLPTCLVNPHFPQIELKYLRSQSKKKTFNVAHKSYKLFVRNEA